MTSLIVAVSYTTMGNKQQKEASKKDNNSKQRNSKKEKTPPVLGEEEELDRKWKEFYSGTIAKFHRNRPLFIMLGSLAKSYRVKQITNKQFGYWYKDESDQMIPKCDSVYADFSINFSLTHNENKIDLRLSAIFNNRKYALFDDNFATKDWTIKLILLNQDLKALWIGFFEKLPIEMFDKSKGGKTGIAPIIYDYLFYSKTVFIDDIYLYKNGTINEISCGLLDSFMDINIEDNSLHIAEYFDILLTWFLSMDATNYRKQYVKTEMIWQN